MMTLKHAVYRVIFGLSASRFNISSIILVELLYGILKKAITIITNTATIITVILL